MKRSLLLLVFIFFCCLPDFSTTLANWHVEPRRSHTTYSDSHKFYAKRGDELKCRIYGTISYGSYVKLFLTCGAKKNEIYYHSTPIFPFDDEIIYQITEDEDYLIEYEYYNYNYENDINIIVELLESEDTNEVYELNSGNDIFVDGFHYVYNGNYLTLFEWNSDNAVGDINNITIPSQVNYHGYIYDVKEIESYAFQNQSSITKVIIPNSILNIGNSSFSGCGLLETVELPQNLTRINGSVFENCSSLTQINVQNIREIGRDAFEGCKSLQQIQFSDSLISIGNYAFYKCTSLNKLVFGNNLKDLGEYAFSGCTSLEYVSIGKSLESVGNAFYESSNIKYLTYLEGCEKTISTGFKNVVTVNLPESLTEISDGTFSGFNKMASIEFPTSLVRIGEEAFSRCGGLSGKVIIPNNVKAIAKNAFHLCSKISDVTIGDNVETIGDYAFYWCSSLKSISFGNKLISIGEGAFDNCRITNLEFNEGLQTIGESAFINNKELVTLKLPSTMLSIGDYAFRNCEKLTNVDFGHGIKSIGAHAFCGCNSMTSLKLPDSLISIGESAFAGSEYGTGKHTFSIVQIGNGLGEVTNVFEGINHNQSPIVSLVIGNSVSKINGSINKIYLLTNNKVSLSGSIGYIYVADVSKYTSNEKIMNIVSTTSYVGEYSGTAPNINFSSALEGYNAFISREYNNVGTYTSMDVTFTKDDFSSTITIPCDYEITKAPLTIIPYDIIITYGDEIPELECFYQGLKNEETPEYALQTLPSVTTNAKKGCDAGEYTLYVSGAESKNYSLTYQTGSLKIKPAKQNITWNQSFDGIVSDSKIELEATSSCGLSIQYSSSDPSIAYIATEGNKTYLYTRKDGVVIITASQAGNNNYEAAENISKTINILPKSATGISLDQNNIELVIGQSSTLKATVYPETAQNKTVTWSSSNSSIASVDQNGLVTAKNIGEATITATTADGSDLSASCVVTVTPILVTSITLNKSSEEITVGGSITLTATILPEDATFKNVSWKSSDESIATVVDGIVIGKKPGTAIISATTTDGSNLSASCTITVLNIPATMISLDQESINLYVDGTAEVKATLYPDDATNKSVAWTTSNASVATVADGVVTAKSEGTAIITAKTTDGSNLSASCQVNVSRYSQTITWNQDLAYVVSGGELIKLEAFASSGLEITYSSSDENIASIFVFGDGSYLNAYGEGEVDIVASQAGNDYYLPVSMTKTVNVEASSGISDISLDEQITVYTLNGFKVGTFSAEEYKKLKLAKGVYIVNGKKMVVK